MYLVGSDIVRKTPLNLRIQITMEKQYIESKISHNNKTIGVSIHLLLIWLISHLRTDYGCGK